MSDDSTLPPSPRPARKGKKASTVPDTVAPLGTESAQPEEASASATPDPEAPPEAAQDAMASADTMSAEPVEVVNPVEQAVPTSPAPARHGVLVPFLAALIGVAVGFGGLFVALKQGLLPLGPSAPVASAPPSGGGERVSTLEAKLKELEHRLSTPSGEGSATLNALKAEIDALKGKASSGADSLSREAQERMKAMGQTIDGYAAEVKALKDRLSQSENALKSVEGSSRAVTEDMAAKIGAMDQKADSASAASTKAALALAVTALRTRVDSGAPYGPELFAVKTLGGDDEALKALESGAAAGTPSASAVRQRFAQTLPAMLAAIPHGTVTSWWDTLQQKAERLVSVRPVGEAQGESPKAVLARAEARTQRNDFAGALAEFAKLPAPVQEAGKAFAEGATARLAAEKALKTLSDQSLAQLGAGAKR